MIKELHVLIPLTEGENKIPLEDLKTSMLLVSQKQGAKPGEHWKITRFAKPKFVSRENFVQGQNVTERFIVAGGKRYGDTAAKTGDVGLANCFMNLHRKTADGKRILESLHLTGEEILKFFADNKIAIKTDEYGAPIVDEYNHKEAAREERRFERMRMMPAAFAGRK